MGKYMPAEFYDNEFNIRPYYLSHYKDSPYLPLWIKLSDLIIKVEHARILEIGCGPGQLAHLLACKGYKNYVGIDFSKVAIQNAKDRLKLYPEFEFKLSNLEDGFEGIDYTVVIGTEVLEHVKDDLAILKKISKGTHVIFSVPCFDARAHVRFFKDSIEVFKRYEDFMEIDYMEVIRIPSIDNKLRVVILFKGVKK